MRQLCWKKQQGGSRGLLVRELDSKSKGCEFESQAGRNWRWGEWMSSALSSLNTTTEVPLSKETNPQLLPRHRSINGCRLLQVCIHGVWVKCRARLQSMGHHVHFFFNKILLRAPIWPAADLKKIQHTFYQLQLLRRSINILYSARRRKLRFKATFE